MPIITIDIAEFKRKDGTVVSAHKRRINVDSLTSDESAVVDGFIESLFNEPQLQDIPEEAIDAEDVIEEPVEDVPQPRKGEGLVETGIIGAALIDSKKILIDAVNQQADTLPHEYAHHYIRMFKSTPLVQEGIKRFGSEEELVQKIGEQAVKQEGEAWGWWTRFKGFLLSFLSDNQVLGVLTDSFLERRDLSEADVVVDAIGYEDSLFDPSVVSEVLDNEPLSQIDPATHEKIAQVLAEKYPDIEVLYTSDIDPLEIEDTTVLFQLSNRVKKDFLARVDKKRPDLVQKGLVDDVIESMNNFMDTLPEKLNNSKTSKALVKWTLESQMILPEDGEKITQILEFSDKNGINMMQYKNPSDILELIEEEGAKELTPESFKEFSNKRHIGGGITLYDIEESKAGQQATRDMIDSDWGERFNNWCITYTQDGQLTDNSYRLWSDNYGGQKTLAFKDGELVSIKASGVWWDKLDNSHEGIPISIRMNDGSGYRTVSEIDEDSTESELLVRRWDSLTKGNKQNGVYEEAIVRQLEIDMLGEKVPVNIVLNIDGEVDHFYIAHSGFSQPELRDPESKHYKAAMAELERVGSPYILLDRVNYKDGKEHGKYERWRDNGNKEYELNYVDGKKEGEAKGYNYKGELTHVVNYKNGQRHGVKEEYTNGVLTERTRWKDGDEHGLQEYFYHNGSKMRMTEYKEGRKDGRNEEWHSNGQKFSEEFYKNGRLDGEQIRWYDDGQIQYKQNYKEGQENGLIELFYRNGQKHLSRTYVHGLQNGTEERWYENGQMESRVNYENGFREGIEEEWYENGQKKFERVHLDGAFDGNFKSWYENGQIELESAWVKGEKNGVEKKWHENGQLNTEGEYVNGFKEGVHKSWTKQGVQALEETYIGGLKNGNSKAWYNNGNLYRDENYVLGIAEGTHKNYFANGQIRSSANYVDGNQEGKAEYWNSDGAKVREDNYKDGFKDGLQAYWYDNGNQKYERNFKSGVRDGVFRQWREDGTLERETNYKDGNRFGEGIRVSVDGYKFIETYDGLELHGPVKKFDDEGNLYYLANYKRHKLDGKVEKWHYNGEKELVENYKDGKLNGETTKYFNNGQIKYTKNFVDDELHGEAKLFDEEGNLIRTIIFDNGVEISRTEHNA